MARIYGFNLEMPRGSRIASCFRKGAGSIDPMPEVTMLDAPRIISAR
jgi:hypothetical protein